MKTHKLKTIQPYFENVWNRHKTFEIRKNDRDFQVGDTIHLQEYDGETDSYSGKEVVGQILYILKHYNAIQDGYVIFSFDIEKYIDGDKEFKA